MLLKSITLCCLMLNVQTQNMYYPYGSQFPNQFTYNPQDYSVIPLSDKSSNELDKNAQRIVYQNEPLNKIKTAVEIQKSDETEFGSTREQAPNDVQWNNLGNRHLTPGRPATQNFAQMMSQISQNRHSVLQNAQYSEPEISLGRPGVAVPQSQPNRPTIQHPSVGVPSYQTGQGQRAPQTSQGGQYTPEILNKPSVAVPGNSLDKATGPQIQTNRPPSASSFNFSTEQATPSLSTKLLYSVTNFGLNLLRTIDGLHSGNVVISPFSISLLLGLLQQGASGQTLAQITNELQMPARETAPAYAEVSAKLRARDALKVANNLFLSYDFPVDKKFESVARTSFNSEVTNLYFDDLGKVARQINSWVASRTVNQIQNLISPDALDQRTQMVLVNAIFFKGLWAEPFRVQSTAAKDFFLSNGQTKTAQFMRMRKLFKTGVDKTTNARVIMLPFDRNEYHMMVVLPSELMGMKRTLASLTGDRLLSYFSFQDLETELELPKFTIRSDTDLTVVLKTMGITNMFSHDLSELNGVGQYGAHSPSVSSAVHSATLSIDEQGGTAAAATAFTAVALSYDDPEIYFRVNRPFIAILWDNKTSLPLFIAKIEDPQQ